MYQIYSQNTWRKWIETKGHCNQDNQRWRSTSCTNQVISTSDEKWFKRFALIHLVMLAEESNPCCQHKLNKEDNVKERSHEKFFYRKIYNQMQVSALYLNAQYKGVSNTWGSWSYLEKKGRYHDRPRKSWKAWTPILTLINSYTRNRIMYVQWVQSDNLYLELYRCQLRGFLCLQPCPILDVVFQSEVNIICVQLQNCPDTENIHLD